jgi:hypothetical protein
MAHLYFNCTPAFTDEPTTSVFFLPGCSLNDYGKMHPMIVEGTHPPVQIDLGNDEAGMTLQRLDSNWVDYKVEGKVVKSPVDIDVLPSGRYRLLD